MKSSGFYCSEKYFEKIDTPEKAYWLGFIYADGYLSIADNGRGYVLGIELSTVDIEHLEKFRKSLKTNYKITKRVRESPLNKGSRIETCGIRIYSKNIVSSLMSHGVTTRKARSIAFPHQLSDNLKVDFIRGYFDGDGSVYYKNIAKPYGSYRYKLLNFTSGSKAFLQDLQRYLLSECGVKTRLGENQLAIDGGVEAQKLLDKMYRDAKTYLDRKFSLYKD